MTIFDSSRLAHPQASKNPNAPKTITVLLVEDNPGDRRLIAELLREANETDGLVLYNLITAVDLAQAMATLNETAVDVVLLDLTLPDSQGLDTCTRLCQQYNDSAIVVLTGHRDPTLSTAALKAGAQDYLLKDHFDGYSLGRAIKYARERHQLRIDLQQKHAELQASEARRIALLDKSNDGILIIDAEGEIVYANPRAATYMNVPVDELVGSVCHNSFQTDYVSELRFQHDDGSTIILETRTTETEWQNTQMRLVYLHDITEQKGAEAARYESEERLRATLASLDDLVFILDENGRFEDYFHTIPHKDTKLRGMPPFVIGRPYQDILPANVVAQLSPALARIKESHWVQQVEYALSLSQREYWFSAKVSARQRNGSYAGATIVIRDITLLKQTEEDLRQRNRQLEILRELSLQMSLEVPLPELLTKLLDRAMVMLNGRGACIFLPNDTHTHLHMTIGTNMDTLTSRTQWQMGEGIPGKIWQQNCPLVFTSETTPSEDECLLPHSSMIGAPIVWHDEFLGVLTILSPENVYYQEHDSQTLTLFTTQAATVLQNAHLHHRIQHVNEELTTRVAERTAELENAYAKLKSLDVLKTKFMSDVSHELRTPTTNLKLYLNLMELGTREKFPRYLSVLNTETERLESIIEGILLLSRLDIEIDNYLGQIQTVHLPTVVNEVLMTKQVLAEEKGLICVVDMPAKASLILGSPKQLAQAIGNLLQNAIFYTQKGEIRITLTETAASLHLAIADTGKGINETDLPHIYDRFYRGTSGSQSNIPGIGLGLTVVKAILDMHNGRIDIDSIPDKGTTVHLTFPIHTPTKPATDPL